MSRTESEEADEVKPSLARPYLKVRVNGRRHQGSSAGAHGMLLSRGHGGDTGSRVARGAAAVAYSLWGENQAVHRAQHLREVWSVDQVTRLCEAAWEYQ